MRGAGVILSQAEKGNEFSSALIKIISEGQDKQY
jgi:hypothetical protein